MLRRLFCLLLIGWFATVALGVPLPTGETAKPQVAGERFPCENCPCGCKSAQHCWSNCCCHSLSERLAWARREGVTPPAFVLAAVKETPRPACCSTSRSCCSKQASCCSPKRVAKSPTPKKNDKRVVVLKALQCQGISFASQSITLAPPPPLVLVSFERNVEAVVTAKPQAVCSPSFAPPTPPPRGC